MKHNSYMPLATSQLLESVSFPLTTAKRLALAIKIAQVAKAIEQIELQENGIDSSEDDAIDEAIGRVTVTREMLEASTWPGMTEASKDLTSFHSEYAGYRHECLLAGDPVMSPERWFAEQQRSFSRAVSNKMDEWTRQSAFIDFLRTRWVAPDSTSVVQSIARRPECELTVRRPRSS